jgi:hypothetical protein
MDEGKMTKKQREDRPGMEYYAALVFKEHLEKNGDKEVKAIKIFSKNKDSNRCLSVPNRDIQ